VNVSTVIIIIISSRGRKSKIRVVNVQSSKVFNHRGIYTPLAGRASRDSKDCATRGRKPRKFSFFLRLLCDNPETYNSDSRLFKFNVRKTYFFSLLFFRLFHSIHPLPTLPRPTGVSCTAIVYSII